VFSCESCILSSH